MKDTIIGREKQIKELQEALVTKKDATNFQTKKKVFKYHTKTKKHLFLTLITTMGVIENTHKLNHIDQIVTLDDLYTT